MTHPTHLRTDAATDESTAATSDSSIVAELEAFLQRTEEALRLYIDASHLSYLPLYLGRADARHALGAPVDEVLRELWLASKVYAVHGGVFLTKWTHQQVRRRRLEPLEVGLIAGDADVLKTLAKTFGIDPFTLFAGIEPCEVTTEISAITGYFKTEECADPVDMAGALAVFYWLMLVCLASEDAEGFETTRRRAGRLVDHQGHLLGGIAQGGIARIKAIHDVIGALRPARPALLATAIVRHGALHHIETQKAWAADKEARSEARGALDRTSLALIAIAKAHGIELIAPLQSAGASARTLAYAVALGHSPLEPAPGPTAPEGETPS